MNKYIYHGGPRTAKEQVTVSVTKTTGDDKFHVTLDVSGIADAMDALESIVKAYERYMDVPAAHILNVLATVMTVPRCGDDGLEEVEE